jgi:hypothetical protein
MIIISSPLLAGVEFEDSNITQTTVLCIGQTKYITVAQRVEI